MGSGSGGGLAGLAITSCVKRAFLGVGRASGTTRRLRTSPCTLWPVATMIYSMSSNFESELFWPTWSARNCLSMAQKLRWKPFSVLGAFLQNSLLGAILRACLLQVLRQFSHCFEVARAHRLQTPSSEKAEKELLVPGI